MVTHETLLLRERGLTAEAVRNSPLVHFTRSAPKNDPEYLDALARNRIAKQKQRAALKARGLTVEGKVPQRQPRPELRGLPLKAYHVRYKQILRDRWLKQGLTTAGTPRKWANSRTADRQPKP